MLFDPSRIISLTGHVRNPFTESLLQLLELPYVLDDRSRSIAQTPINKEAAHLRGVTILE